MTKKDEIKNEILIKMKQHLSKVDMMILESAISEALYQIDIVDKVSLPSTINNTNEYILGLYELKRGLVLKESTMKGYMIVAREFVKYINKPLVNVTKDDIEYYLAIKQRKENNQNTSLNNKRRKLNSLFTWMRKNGFIQENPMDNIDCFKETLKPVDYLTAVEMEQIKDGCKTKRDRALIEWLRSTATRRGEIPYININQIDWKSGKVTVYGEKTNTYRMVMLDNIAIKYLSEYIIEERGLSLESDLPLFTHIRGDKTKALKKSGLYAEIKRIGNQSGLSRRVYPHLFRKTTATNIIKRGGTTDDAGLYIGHRPEGVTARHYTGVTDGTVQKIFQNYVESI